MGIVRFHKSIFRVSAAPSDGCRSFAKVKCAIHSLQLAWTVQQVFGVVRGLHKTVNLVTVRADIVLQPYLSSLGIPDTQMPIFIFSGPLAGLVGPPSVAALSSSYINSWGSRKPLVYLGGLGTMLSFMILATARPLADTLCPSAAAETSHVIAGLSIYTLNFSIQPLQLGLRASVIDRFGPHEQFVASLWISCFSTSGSVFITLVALGYSPTFRILSAVVVFILALILCVVAFTDTTKSDPRWLSYGRDAVPVSSRTRISQLFRLRRLPPITGRTCKVQLVSWFAWFLVLNYTSA